jgi:hypothetical protein
LPWTSKAYGADSIRFNLAEIFEENFCQTIQTEIQQRVLATGHHQGSRPELDVKINELMKNCSLLDLLKFLSIPKPLRKIGELHAKIHDLDCQVVFAPLNFKFFALT